MRHRLILTHLLAVAIGVAGAVAVGRWSAAGRSPAPPAAPFDETGAGLERRIAEVRLEGVTPAEAFAELERLGGARIEVDWDQLAAAGVGRKRPVYMHLRRVKLGNALTQLLTQLGEASEKRSQFGYVTRGNVIRVGDSTKLPAFARAYDVRDLIEWAREREHDEEEGMRQKVPGPFAYRASFIGTGPTSYRTPDAELGDELTRLVQGYVDPDT